MQTDSNDIETLWPCVCNNIYGKNKINSTSEGKYKWDLVINDDTPSGVGICSNSELNTSIFKNPCVYYGVSPKLKWLVRKTRPSSVGLVNVGVHPGPEVWKL